MNRLKLGIIGCGKIGRAHLTAATGSSRIAVTAVADVHRPAAEEAAASLAEPVSVHDSAEALIADAAVDAVVLALPTAARQGMADRALRQGLHVLLEKPPAMHADELLALRSVRGDRVVACASSRFRCYDSARAATRFMADQPLGPIRLVRFRGIAAATPKPDTPPPAWRLSRSLNGGGILANWAIYDLDYLLGILGFTLQPRRVFARIWATPVGMSDWVAKNSDAENHATALIDCTGGAAIAMERGELLPTVRDNAWQIIGEHAALRLNMLPGKGKQLLFDRVDATEGVVTQTLWEGDDAGDTAHAGPVLDFADAILDGREPATNLEQAITLQRLVDAIYASADRGEAVDLPTEDLR